MHFARKPDAPGNIVQRLESTGAKVFTIHTNTRDIDLEELQPNIAKWPEPSLALIRGTTLELAPFRSSPGVAIGAVDGEFDALLYVGHPLTITYAGFTNELCGDAEYIRMRTQRRGDPKSIVGVNRESCLKAVVIHRRGPEVTPRFLIRSHE